MSNEVQLAFIKFSQSDFKNDDKKDLPVQLLINSIISQIMSSIDNEADIDEPKVNLIPFVVIADFYLKQRPILIQQVGDFEIIDKSIRDWTIFLPSDSLQKLCPSNSQHYSMRMTIMSGKFTLAERRALWKNIVRKYNGYEMYEKYRRINPKYQYQILLDVQRTQFQQITGDGPEDQAAEKNLQNTLNEILNAYTFYDKETGYTQGMNYIVGALIDIYSEMIQNKKTMGVFVFTIFVLLFMERGYRGYFLDGFSELMLFQSKLQSELERELPDVLEYLEFMHIQVHPGLTQMCLSLFLDQAPKGFNNIVVDLLIFDDNDILVRLFVAMLKLFRTRILGMEFGDLYNFIKKEISGEFYIWMRQQQNLEAKLYELGLNQMGKVKIKKTQPSLLQSVFQVK